jgi:heptosyltransferase-2
VLVATPLLKGLKAAFPESKVSIGVGDWAVPLLENNPYVDEIVACNAPWHNKQNCKYPANSPKTFLEGLIYVFFSQESRCIAKKQFTHGIDMLGSRQGSWFMRRCGIPHRFGVQGYAGGDKWCKSNVIFRENQKVAEAGLAFLPLLDPDYEIDVEPRPIINLTQSEISWAKDKWGEKRTETKRIIIAPGGGFPEKCWGDRNYNSLIKLLLQDTSLVISIIGSKEDIPRINVQENERIKNWIGRLNLRQSAAIVSQSDFVITNTSLCMHLAGAFSVPSLTLLGNWYDSANLHQKQWGYPESIIKGKEVEAPNNLTCSPSEAFGFTLNGISKANSQN